MKLINKVLLAVLALLFFIEVNAQNNFWRDVPEPSPRGGLLKRVSIPDRYRTVRLDTSSLLSFLRTVPREFTGAAVNTPSIISIPVPGGLTQQFTIAETVMMEPGLAAAAPFIKTYGGQGIDDPTATIKIDWTPQGFHAMVFSPVSGTFAVDPYAEQTVTEYLSYYKSDLPARTFMEEMDPLDNQKEKPLIEQQRTQAICAGGTLRSFRLAVACTGEYAVALGADTKEKALAAIVTSINRVNGIYEKELSIRLVLVANNLKIAFIDPATDPFTKNNDGSGLLTESQNVITDSIGSANYDVGHTFSTGAGGIAGLGVVCSNSNKARGVTGLNVPRGDAYDIDYVAHELGHQFGARHPFNAVTGNCASNRSATTAVEPGSGSTIMAYAGICGTNDLQRNSDPYFHSISFVEINTFLNAGGSSCSNNIATGNTPPVVNAGGDYVIPMSTPFLLTGTASDANGDALTYSWEQIDTGPEGNWNTPSGNAPIFRSFLPLTTPTRTFPRVANLVANTVTIGEILPAYARNLQFRFTARDNRSGGGGVCSDEMNITVANSTPFAVTAPNTATTWDAGDFKTVTWNVSNTNNAPVNCAAVSIQLSTDGGLTFPITLLANTPNDGQEEIQVPNNLTTAARIRVMAVGNIFFDISNANFTIRTAPVPDFVFNNPAVVLSCSGTNVAGAIKSGALGGFDSPVTLSATGNPAGTTVVFGANPITPSSTTSVTLQGNIPAGVYDVTIKGVAGSIEKTRVIQFRIGQPQTAPEFISPVNNSVGLSLLPIFTWNTTVDAQTYNLLVSGSPGFTDTVQSVTGIVSNNHALQIPLAPDTKYYWRIVAVNSCGASPASASASFITVGLVCRDTIYSTNVPLTIPANNTATINSTLIIPSGGTIADIDVVNLKGTHAYVSDLKFTLLSPAGTQVILVNSVCGSLENFNLNLDDQATSGTVTCPPTTGQSVRPVQPLSVLNNQSATGTWTLRIDDQFSGDGGSLTSWGLRICTYATVYTFTGNGNWSNPANWKNNSVPPLTLGANNQIIIDPAAGQCILDVPQVISKDGLFTVRPGKTLVINVSLSLL